MKEDVLEQVVEDYLQLCGYITRDNLRFRPQPTHHDSVPDQDSVPSEVDVIGYKLQARGCERVWMVPCKSWQPGFDADAKLRELRR